MAKLLYAATLLFALSGLADHPMHPTNQGSDQACHEKCKAQFPDMNSAEHKSCMDTCQKAS